MCFGRKLTADDDTVPIWPLNEYSQRDARSYPARYVSLSTHTAFVGSVVVVVVPGSHFVQRDQRGKGDLL